MSGACRVRAGLRALCLERIPKGARNPRTSGHSRGCFSCVGQRRLALNPENLEVHFNGCIFGVSARRFFEHLTLGQVNPFAPTAASVRSLRDVAEVVDLVRFEHGWTFSLTGLTLASLERKGPADPVLEGKIRAVRRGAAQPDVRALLGEVMAAAMRHAARRAARNAPARFLAAAGVDDRFGVPGLYSRLAVALADRASDKAPAKQWQGTLDNLSRKGLRSEELQRSGIVAFLEARAGDNALISGGALLQAVDFSALRISVIANISEARTQLRFEEVPERELPKIRGEKRPQAGQQRKLHLFDRSLGYRIEEVGHPALWGMDRHWQAVTFNGSVLRHRHTRRVIFESRDEAVARAQEHAREVLPKLLASERWVDWSWTGGADYREWLVTLPFYPGSFVENHFGVRNVLVHVRCDVREGVDGERVLLLHEVQSDWMQLIRRNIQRYGKGLMFDALTPFLQEWPALALKLMLLHAAQLGADAVGWTTGAQQSHRYRGGGREGLLELYDRTLPREAARMLKPFGLECRRLEVYVPDNFGIRHTEAGYEVRTAEGKLLGVAASFSEARALMPDGAHERLYGVHGVRMDEGAREAILKAGFAAWG